MQGEIEDVKQELLAQYESFTSNGGWLLEVVILFGAALFGGIVISRLLAFLEKRSFFQKSFWRHTCVSALRSPLVLLIWTIALALAFRALNRQGYVESYSEPVSILCSILYVLVIAWFLLRWKSRVERVVSEQINSGQIGIGRSQLHVISKLVTIAIIFVSFLLLLDAADVDIGAILAVGGIGGIAIGFAGKDVFANFFSGFMIYATRPFIVGDWVRSPDKEIEGTVEHIGWYLTRIRAFDKRPIYVPNSLFSTIVVVNPSRMTHRQIKTMLSLRYCDAPVIDAVVKDLTAYLRGHIAIDTNQRVMVYFKEFADYSLELFVYCFCKTTDWAGWLAVQQEIFLEFTRIIQSHGADFAFPTQTLDLPTIRVEPDQTSREESRDASVRE